MADFTDLVTVITLLKRLLASGIQVDADTRAEIEKMSDDEVVAYARNLLSEAEQNAGNFIDRLNAEGKEEE